MILNEKEVKESIEKYMAAYDKRVTAEENEEEVDEDGFIKVSSKKKRGQFAPQRKESTIEEKKKKLQKEKKLVNFYQFQIRETKKQQLEEMRKKFELDKQKVKQLKSQRIFKPFG
ncbi:GSCOCG00006371001-RA-CDS [Cotesia congregata]|nr:GSCOCG00006371001-RA-CDS [Cotesia congregata]